MHIPVIIPLFYYEMILNELETDPKHSILMKWTILSCQVLESCEWINEEYSLFNVIQNDDSLCAGMQCWNTCEGQNAQFIYKL